MTWVEFWWRVVVLLNAFFIALVAMAMSYASVRIGVQREGWVGTLITFMFALIMYWLAFTSRV